MSQGLIHNPVLRGFHPDPSIVRVGRDYFLATSTFEWYPAVPLHHSTDLMHWRPAGHGELVETPAGEVFLAHLASRPLSTPDGPRCVLGREACLQRVSWTADGWLRLAHGGHYPLVDVPSSLPANPWPASAERDDFDKRSLDAGWCTLRGPLAEPWVSLSERPGWLRLRGRQSLRSTALHGCLRRRMRTGSRRPESGSRLRLLQVGKHTSFPGHLRNRFL